MSAVHRTARSKFAIVLGGALLFGLLDGVVHGAPEGGSAYVDEIETWRTERETRLSNPEGWLTLVGLSWLKPGDSEFGSHPDATVRFPAGAAPEIAGTLKYDGSTVWLKSATGVELTVNGNPATEATLKDDSEGSPDEVRVGRLLFYVIERNGRHAVRIKDPESPVLLDFHGLNWFPVDSGYRVVGRFEAFDEPLSVEVPTAAGTQASMWIPGTVTFNLNGKDWSLRPLVGSPGETELFFIIKDRTSGRETYGAGRYLYGTLEQNRVILDFNKAYNPPCVFTRFATCPLPPRENRLGLSLLAGEKSYDGH